MKLIRILAKALCGALVLPSLLSSCSDMGEYFEVPFGMGGSIYQELSDEGNYGIFLKGVDIAGYNSIMNGKSILTVMAPDDNAMKTYLMENYQVDDISMVPLQDVKKLIGFHILYYSFDKEKLTNFRPSEGDGASNNEKAINAGLNYKYRTHSQDADEIITDPLGRRYTVVHHERLLPVFSYKMFSTKTVDAKSNYEYFYPETGWNGNDGFQIANANVTEYAKTSRNGYIYKIDRVIRPLNTIYQEMKQRGNFSRIISLYDKSQNFVLDAGLMTERGSTDSLFYHYHNKPLVNIDSEWGETVDFKQMTAMSSTAYSMFAPTDEAFQNFFDQYWKFGGYASIEEVDSANFVEILNHSVNNKSIAMPEEITKGLITDITKSQEVIDFDVNAVPQENRTICSNGVLYGCSVLTPPAKYRSVAGPAYQYKKLNIFQQMINNSGLSNTLIQNAVRYIMLFPDDDQFFQNVSYKAQGDGIYNLLTIPVSKVSNKIQSEYVNGHLAIPEDDNTVIPTTGTKVYATSSTNDIKNYWYVKDGKITNSILYNHLLQYNGNTLSADNIWATFTPLPYCGDPNGWTNGHAYSYSTILFPPNYEYSQVDYATFAAMMRGLRNTDKTTLFWGWSSLLYKGGLYNSSEKLDFLVDNCMQFVPTTEVLEQSIVNGEIPGVNANGALVGDEAFFNTIIVTDKTALREYVKQYYVPLSTITVTNYPYLGWGENTKTLGGLNTMNMETKLIDGILTDVANTLNVYDDGNALSVTITSRVTQVEGKKVKIRGDFSYLPQIFADGPVYFLESCF
jgi:hypothetical protein